MNCNFTLIAPNYRAIFGAYNISDTNEVHREIYDLYHTAFLEEKILCLIIITNRVKMTDFISTINLVDGKNLGHEFTGFVVG